MEFVNFPGMVIVLDEVSCFLDDSVLAEYLDHQHAVYQRDIVFEFEF